jgi:hypothetical protein
MTSFESQSAHLSIKADYNILFKESTGEQSTAQIQAFYDFWQWDIEAKHTLTYMI